MAVPFVGASWNDAAVTLAPRRPAPVRTLSAAQARRAALAAQQLHRSRSTSPAGRSAAGAAAIRRLVDRIGVLQIDSVNVLARAHYLPVFARLGHYDQAVLDRASWPRRARDRRLLESWAHVASFVSVDTEPLLRWRQQRMEWRWRP